MGYNPLSVTEEQFTTSLIINEVQTHTTPYARLKLALEAGKLKIHTPSTTSLEEVEKASRRVGDFSVLSGADKDVLAAALDLSRSGFFPHLVSDDYAIQNVAEFLKINYVSLTTFGIRYQFTWIIYCPGCKRRYPSNTAEVFCRICATQLKRKVVRKKTLRR